MQVSQMERGCYNNRVFAEICGHFSSKGEFMDLHDLQDAGSEILDEVNRAVRENDFSSLGDTIRQSVSDIAHEVSNDVTRTLDARRAADPGAKWTAQPKDGYTSTARQHTRYSSKLTPFLQRKVNKHSGKGRMVLGAVGTVFWGILSVIALAGGVLTGIFTGGVIAGLIIGFGLTAGSVVLIADGRRRHEQADRYYQYGKIIGKKEYYSIEELADKTGHSEDFIRRDLEKMSRDDLLPNLWFDRNHTTLMLTEGVYDQYQQAEKSRIERENTAQKTAEEEEGLDEHVRKILRKGEVYQQTIRRCAQDIRDEEMKGKTERLEKTLDNIFSQVRKNPDSARDLRRLMDYYLPTTTKLLYAYIELDKVPQPGQNVIQTKSQIEEAFDTINEAFENLYNDMYETVAWDIASDIDVMKTFMKQDGLTGDEDLDGNPKKRT